MSDLLRADRVTVAFDGDPVLQERTLVVRAGELVVLAGPSGSGKSTLLAVLAGLLPHSRAGDLWGRVCHRGRDVTLEPPWQRSAWLGFLAQDPASSLCLSRVRDEIALPLENAGVPPGEIGPRVRAVAERLGVVQLLDRPTRHLSGGEQQRVALAATLVGRPEVVLLDEPLSMLDPESAAEVADVLRREFRPTHGPRRDVPAEPGPPAAVIVEHRAAELARAVLVPDRVVQLGETRRPAGDPRPGVPGPVLLERRLRNVRRAPEGPVVLEDVQITLHAGTVTVLAGPNGSGKSTLLLTLAGLLPGSLRDPRVGLAFQRPENQFVATTVLDEAAWGADRDRARALLHLAGLDGCERLSPHRLSLGQQRRLSLVALAAHDHPVLLLDEPTFGLDDAGVAAVEALIRLLRDQGRALLVATHDRALADRLADRTIRLAGRSALPPPEAPAVESPLARCSPVLTFLLILLAGVGLLTTTAVWPVAAAWAFVTLATVPLARARLGRVLTFQLPAAWLALSEVAVNAVSRSGPALSGWGPLPITATGVAWGLALGARTLAIGALAAMFVLSTDALRFLDSLHQQAHVPVRYAYALLAGYRLLELLPEEWWTIRAAHAVRIGDGRRRGRRAWLGDFARSGFQLLVVTLRRGQQLAEALEARGLGRTPRTIHRPMSWGWRDVVLAGAFMVAVVLVAVLVKLGPG